MLCWPRDATLMSFMLCGTLWGAAALGPHTYGNKYGDCDIGDSMWWHMARAHTLLSVSALRSRLPRRTPALRPSLPCP
jgi:hypothetical protein